MTLLTFKIQGLLNGKHYETYLMGYNVYEALKSLPSFITIICIETI